MKTYQDPTSGLHFNYPNDWIVDEENNLVSVYNPIEGVGALQFSSYQISESGTPPSAEALNDYVQDRHTKYKILENKNYAYTDYLEGDDAAYWKYFLFLIHKTLIFATYSCEEKNIGKEDNIIENIVLSAIQ